MGFPAGTEPRTDGVTPRSAPGDGQTKDNTIPPAAETSGREERNANNQVARAPAACRKTSATSPVLRDGKDLNRGSGKTLANVQHIALANPTAPSYESPVVSIKDLKPAQSAPWAVIARVFARNPVRAWKNFQDGGTLLELYVTDSLELCIRATLFNQAVDMFSAITVPGATCYFSGGCVRRAFAAGGASIEISFGKECEIRVSPNPLDVVPAIPCQSLARLYSLPEHGAAKTLLIVHAVGGLKRILTRKGKSVEKRDLLLVDDTDTSMVCTTWGQLAQAIGEILEGTVVLVWRGSISDYNNTRSVSIGAGSEILQDPFLDRAEELRRWYAGLSPDHTFRGLSPNFIPLRWLTALRHIRPATDLV